MQTLEYFVRLKRLGTSGLNVAHVKLQINKELACRHDPPDYQVIVLEHYIKTIY